MSEDEKRFKILKIQKYEEKLSVEQKRTINKGILMGLATLVAVGCFFGLANAQSNTLHTLIDGILCPLGAGYSIYNLIGMLESMGKKTIFKDKIEDLKDELEFEEKGRLL